MPLWTKLVFQVFKNSSYFKMAFLYTSFLYIPAAIEAFVIALIGIKQGEMTTALILEGIFSIIPVHSLAIAYSKILYRAKFYPQDGMPNTDPWGYSGCRMQLYGLSFGMVAFPLISFWMQRAKSFTVSEPEIT